MTADAGRRRAFKPFDSLASSTRDRSFVARWINRIFQSGQSLFDAVLVYTPLLWMLGALAATCVLLVIKLSLSKWPRGKLVNAVVFSWLFIGFAQAYASLLNGVSVGDFGQGIRAALGFGVTGWIIGGLGIAIGAAHRLGGPTTIRAIARVGAYIFVLAIIAVIFYAMGFRAIYEVPTPVQILIGFPKETVLASYTSAILY